MTIVIDTLMNRCTRGMYGISARNIRRHCSCVLLDVLLRAASLLREGKVDDDCSPLGKTTVESSRGMRVLALIIPCHRHRTVATDSCMVVGPAIVDRLRFGTL